jgi:hypothetical protein
MFVLVVKKRTHDRLNTTQECRLLCQCVLKHQRTRHPRVVAIILWQDRRMRPACIRVRLLLSEQRMGYLFLRGLHQYSHVHCYQGDPHLGSTHLHHDMWVLHSDRVVSLRLPKTCHSYRPLPLYKPQQLNKSFQAWNSSKEYFKRFSSWLTENTMSLHYKR